MKTCSTCKQEKSLGDFHKNKCSSDGYQSNCKNCNCEKTKQRDPDQWRKYNLMRNFGITPEQYNTLLEKQKHRCAICDKHEDQFKKKLAVDHDHQTHRIRGLLCTACNYHLIRRHRDASILRKMADYVDQGTEWYVPVKQKKKKRKPNKVFYQHG